MLQQNMQHIHFKKKKIYASFVMSQQADMIFIINTKSKCRFKNMVQKILNHSTRITRNSSEKSNVTKRTGNSKKEIGK